MTKLELSHSVASRLVGLWPITLLPPWLGVALLLLPSTGQAQTPQGLEIETDPIAWALDGFSLHLASQHGPTRLSVGTFGIRVPERFHGNEDWGATMRGAGVKWGWVGESSSGPFAGLDVGWMRMRYTHDSSARDRVRNEIGLGVRAGTRYHIGSSGLFVSPWASLSYNPRGGAVSVAESSFEQSRVTIFPTVHIGWSF
jgi:hypothetical protein